MALKCILLVSVLAIALPTLAVAQPTTESSLLVFNDNETCPVATVSDLVQRSYITDVVKCIMNAIGKHGSKITKEHILQCVLNPKSEELTHTPEQSTSVGTKINTNETCSVVTAEEFISRSYATAVVSCIGNLSNKGM